MQIKEVDVRFSKNGKKYTFDAGDLFVNQNDKVVVETSKGTEVATICSKVRFKDYEDSSNIKKIIRIANEEDLNKKQTNIVKGNEIKETCQKIATQLNLDMKVIKAEVALDMSKVIIFFISENRVDFRDLVKQLASNYKIKIELKQIEQREEVKIVGGIGPCGQVCCCNQFLNQPQYSSIKMAKNQNLALNPTSVSGLCGKLKCCLAYENEYYTETIKIMPKINSEVETPDGKATVMYNDLLKRRVLVNFAKKDEPKNTKEFELEEIKFNKEEQENVEKVINKQVNEKQKNQKHNNNNQNKSKSKKGN